MKFGVAFAFGFVLMSLFAGERGLPAVLKARRQARALAVQIGMLRVENEALRTRASALRSDPATIESEARETLGLARPGELVIIRRR